MGFAILADWRCTATAASHAASEAVDAFGALADDFLIGSTTVAAL
jgi:hypothetical protein